MKIVQINAVCEPGSSTGRTVCEWSDYLNQQGIENIVMYGNGKSSRENAYYIGSTFDHKVHALLSRITGKQGYYSYFATRKMLKQLKQFQPDLVHLRNLHGNYISLPLLFHYLIKNKIATVITLHDCFFYTGKCVHYIDANCEKWQTECRECPQLQNGNQSWFFDRTRTMFQDKKRWFSKLERLGVTGVSKWVTDEGKKSFLAKNAKFKAIYNWIDMDSFYPHTSDIRERFGITNEFLILGVASYWNREKGLDDFNQLADMLDERFRIVLVGNVSGKLNEKILHIKRTSDVGMLSDLYAAADVFFNPTRRETFGKVTAEALACGTPAIVYDATACPELVGDGCGHIEKVGDVDAVCRDILTMEEEGKDYSKICREFAEKNFDKEKLLKQMLQFYKEVLWNDEK